MLIYVVNFLSHWACVFVSETYDLHYEANSTYPG